MRSSPALPIGLFADVDAHDDRVGLGPGDFLVFYTDGITETRSADGDFFGEERLVAFLSTLAGRPAEEVADAVLTEASAFSDGTGGGPGSGEVHGLGDDVAVLIVRVPDDAGADRVGRVVAATGLPIDAVELPGYPRDTATSC